MTRFYKVFIPIVIALTLIWGISSLSDMVKDESTFVPFTLYSEVVGEFASLYPGEDNTTRYYDHAGQEYTEEQFDSILPSFYARQLIMDGRLPDTIQGRAISQKLIEQENFIFISHPSSLNAHTTPLYFLLESKSKRVNLEMPSDVFRLTESGIEFIDMETNKIDPKKSQLFQQAFEKKGVQFPIQVIAGNPTTRKAYDNGYLLVDKANQLYHLKQNVGRPYLRQITLPQGVVPIHLFVTEYPSLTNLGFVVDDANRFYALRLPDYELVEAELPSALMQQEKMTIFGNAFFWTVVQSSKEGVQYTALDAQSLKKVKSLHFDIETPKGIADYLVPFQITFTASEHEYFLPSIHSFSIIGLFLWIVTIGGWCFYRQRRKPL